MLRLALLPLFAAFATLTACGSESGAPSGSSTSPSPASDLTLPGPTTGRGPAGAATIRLSVGGSELTATLRDTVAARDLVALLPTTVVVRDHGGVEKTGPLPRALDVSEEPKGADPEVGDLGYYAPGNDLVLYHGDQGYYPGIVVLGRIDGDLRAIAEAPDGVSVDVRPAP